MGMPTGLQGRGVIRSAVVGSDGRPDEVMLAHETERTPAYGSGTQSASASRRRRAARTSLVSSVGQNGGSEARRKLA